MKGTNKAQHAQGRDPSWGMGSRVAQSKGPTISIMVLGFPLTLCLHPASAPYLLSQGPRRPIHTSPTLATSDHCFYPNLSDVITEVSGCFSVLNSVDFSAISDILTTSCLRKCPTPYFCSLYLDISFLVLLVIL